MLNSNTYSLFKLGNELGTINLAAHGSSQFSEKSDFLLDHGIQQHLIILSVDEISHGSRWIEMNLLSGLQMMD